MRWSHSRGHPTFSRAGVLSSLKADGKDWGDAGSFEKVVLGHLIVDGNGTMWETEIERIHVPWKYLMGTISSQHSDRCTRGVADEETGSCEDHWLIKRASYTGLKLVNNSKFLKTTIAWRRAETLSWFGQWFPYIKYCTLLSKVYKCTPPYLDPILPLK